MNDQGGIEWDDIAAMYRRLGEEWRQPRASVLIASPEYLADMTANIPRVSDMPYIMMMSVRLRPDDEMSYGHWKLLDQYGEVMKEQ
jgi:hypothetical protein